MPRNALDPLQEKPVEPRYYERGPSRYTVMLLIAGPIAVGVSFAAAMYLVLSWR